jgi:hypothetical protein
MNSVFEKEKKKSSYIYQDTRFCWLRVFVWLRENDKHALKRERESDGDSGQELEN